MLSTGTITHSEAQTLTGRLNHAADAVPLSRHFLSRIRWATRKAEHKRRLRLNPMELADLRLWLETFLPAAKAGINMNLLTFRVPTHIYRSDACEHCLGGFSAKGRAWRYVIPENLLFRAHISLLELIAAMVGPWIDSIEGNLPPLSVTLAMGDNTNAAGWLRKSNFVDDNESAPHAAVKLMVARKHAQIHIESHCTNYSQWFPGVQNIVSDSLSRDYHLSPTDLCSLLSIAVPEQIPPDFVISPLPLEISSWIALLLGKLPADGQREVQRKTSELSAGLVGTNFSSKSNSARIQEWRDSNAGNASPYSPPLHNISESLSGTDNMAGPWLREQSKIPWTTWHRPFGMITDGTQDLTVMEKPALSFHSSFEDTALMTDPSPPKRQYRVRFSLNSNEPTEPKRTRQHTS